MGKKNDSWGEKIDYWGNKNALTEPTFLETVIKVNSPTQDGCARADADLRVGGVGGRNKAEEVGKKGEKKTRYARLPGKRKNDSWGKKNDSWGKKMTLGGKK